MLILAKVLMKENNKNVDILIILDGWGFREETEGNAVAQANIPFLDSMINTYPNCKLLCSGNEVGLPDGTMGNSEVGHMNIGAGRRVFQDFVRINNAIKDKTFFNNPALVDIMQKVARSQKSLHLMGLLSDGGVHSHINHLFALIDMAKQNQIEQLFIHPILDGRDTSPTSGFSYIKQLQDYLDKAGIGRIATIVGRYYAMDRDTRWDRVERAYQLFTVFTEGQGVQFEKAVEAVRKSYDAGTTDEFVEPVFMVSKNRVGDMPQGIITDGDGLIFFNFRADRAKEITRAFTQKDFSEFKRKKTPELCGFVCMTRYDENFGLPVAFGPQHLSLILGEILSQNNIRQLRIAETEKYAHVTYFFNGGDEKVFEGEERLLIPSPRDVATYDLKPGMSACEVADTACEKIRTKEFDFIVLNFANMDMLGHTGVLEAAVKACETVDQCVKKVVEAIQETGGTAIITADHGNAEQMTADDGSIHTAHTLNPVRLILAGEKYKDITLRDGILGDIAPTVLKILNISQADDMTGKSLF
jgi:2,3-bisphosphoglycerate-independent phosphoglycerate mutase